MKRKVRVTGPGVKLNNVWCYINEEAVIDEKQYKENEKYVEVIEEIEETKTEEVKTAAPAVQTETVEEKKQEENNSSGCYTNTGTSISSNTSGYCKTDYGAGTGRGNCLL